ncbi:MAG: flap endonuclease-1 [Candidatus Aenigmarchaeota archaeon]|nr:flap endonuclease-1 [Candidatus Aenigmarchaeota archaeon]
MGVQFGGIIKGKEIEIESLRGRKIAIDAFNTMFQFLTTIRDRETGEPLKDSHGFVTSHLSGLLYRTTKFIEAGIKPVYVFDGKRPEFKYVSAERAIVREAARVRWHEHMEKGETEEGFKAAKMSATINQEMIDHAKKLLEYMGVPVIQAPSEGEAQCAWMCANGEVWASASQDWDSIIFGSPRFIRNLSISGKRRSPKTGAYFELKPEVIESKQVFASLGLTREQMIVMAMLMGTDFNEGVEKYGPKRSLELVKKEKPKEIISKFNLPENVYEFFLNPPHAESKIEEKELQPDKIMKLMVDEHEFSRERIEKVIDTLKRTGGTNVLSKWLK